ncbi:Stp1/IreP family PP2C-type Ser/Thr phosphatase [Alkalibacillus salilacus]|uniref:Protein phosphatase n=1 Tax=Alkalibacillus salilacus TaxID=284582 RepID=A0ABT9VDU8_9BACI|nr:Stp1/IreP family PP2C-type Ser/Thr phosphatase [Alkalibacillus salilacus]MDQ0159142.1 protein phosphatase [Alkalibacillus salilacus]
MHAVFKSDQGKVRQANEDSGGLFYNHGNQLLAVVADGMGGHQAGDVASSMATKYMQSYWEDTEPFYDVQELEVWLDAVVQEVNDVLVDHAASDLKCSGMGTTLVAVAFIGQTVVAANVGDSRLYQITPNTIEQKTQDHSFVNELVHQGHITEEEAESHPKKNILTRALGTAEEIVVDIISYSVQSPAYSLLCTDGLTNKLSNDELLHIVQTNETIDTSVEQLIVRANELGGEDNITAILVELSFNESGDSSWS